MIEFRKIDPPAEPTCALMYEEDAIDAATNLEAEGWFTAGRAVEIIALETGDLLRRFPDDWTSSV